jgi:hypothetical protein
MKFKVVGIIPLLFMLGCASSKYTWSGYDDNLYAYYKDPANNVRFLEKLKESVLKADQTGKVPPGLYAEYGYMLYENRNYTDALIYFKKEHELWPEARFFMAKMIKNTEDLIAKQQIKETTP